MFCCIHDPRLASLLAGHEEAMPNDDTDLLVLGFLALQMLCLLAIGALP